MDKIKILDIGAANYVIDDCWLYLKHEIEVILFEPDKRSYDQLKQKGFETYNSALGQKSEMRNLNLTRKPECSSFFVPNTDFLNRFPNKERWDIINTEEVKVKPLDSFDLDVDFIKLDTQGSELEILKGSVQTLKGVLGLEVEVSFVEIYKNQPLFGEVNKFLSENGFEFFEFNTEYRYGRQELNRKGQLAFADALFLRTPEVVSKFNKKKNEKYISIVKAFRKEDLAQELRNLNL
jgi:FkbM family methyltransferase